MHRVSTPTASESGLLLQPPPYAAGCTAVSSGAAMAEAQAAALSSVSAHAAAGEHALHGMGAGAPHLSGMTVPQGPALSSRRAHLLSLPEGSTQAASLASLGPQHSFIPSTALGLPILQHNTRFLRHAPTQAGLLQRPGPSQLHQQYGCGCRLCGRLLQSRPPGNLPGQ